MIDEREEYYRLLEKNRTKSYKYIDSLETVLPFGLDYSSSGEFNQNITSTIDTALRCYYQNSFESANLSHSVVRDFYDEEGRKTGQSRHVITSINSFVPCKIASLPRPEESSTFINNFGHNEFRRNINTSLLIYDTVIVSDPMMHLLQWEREYQSSGFGYEEFDESDKKSVLHLSNPKLFLDWLDFLKEYRGLIENGSINIVNTSYPEWNFRYHRGGDSDKATQLGIEHHVENYAFNFWHPGFKEEEFLDQKIKGNWVSSDEIDIARRIFWSELYARKSAVFFEKPDYARKTFEHCAKNFELLAKTAVDGRSAQSAVLSAGFVLKPDALSAADIKSIRSDSESIAELRKDISSLCELFLVEDESVWNLRIAERSEEFYSSCQKVLAERNGSNFMSSFIDNSRDGFIALAGGVIGATVGGAQSTGIIGACVGGTLPVLFNTPKYLREANSSRRRRIIAQIICSSMTD